MDTQTAEAGEEYLNGMNFRALIEWVTAETLLSRPEDPLTFIRSIINEKLSQRSSGEKYTPEHAVAYIKQCYAEASSSADENGKICIRRKKESSAEIPTDVNSLKKLNLLEKIIQASRIIAMQLDPFEATNSIIKQTCNILQADRATLYIIDTNKNELVLHAAEGVKNIRVPFGTGIAGTVASTGKLINLPSAYSDPIFDPQYDLENGYKTNTVLCIPVRNGEGKIVGVLQVLNKKDNTPFTDQDEEVVSILGAQAGVALHNANIHRMAIVSQQRVRSLLDIIKAMHGDLGMNSLMFTITQSVQSLVNCDRCTLFMVDNQKSELWSIQGEINIRIPNTEGIAGAVSLSGETINIKNAYDDIRFSNKNDQKVGYKTQTILAMPFKEKNGEIIAVLQLLNKIDGVFNVEDEEILDMFLMIAAPILSNSQLFSRSKGEESGNELTGKQIQKRSLYDGQEMNNILENEDENDEEDD